MDYQLFFEEDDALYYQILQQLIRHHGQRVSEAQLQDQFSLTPYRLHKAITTINNDLVTISNADNPIYLDEPEKGILRGNQITTVALQKVGLIYLQRSLVFVVFEYHYIYAHQSSKTDYMKEHFISNATFYHAESRMKKIIKQLDFSHTVVSKSLTSTEYMTRLHLFQLYYTAYNGIDSPFSDLDPLITMLIDQLKAVFDISYTPTRLNKLSIFLKLWIIRVTGENPVAANLLTDIPQSLVDQLQAIRALLAKEYLINVSDDELDYLYTFLMVQDYIAVDVTRFSPDIVPAANHLTDLFMKNVAAHHILVDPAQLTQFPLRDKISNIHIQFTTFYIEPTTFVDASQVSFFQESYPLFDEVVSSFIMQLQRNSDFKFTAKDATNLYFSYMFALINAIPTAALVDKVYVCVDFSQGDLYTDYIVSTLQAFNNAHIVIEENISDHTNIYLSDFYSSFITQPQIIWQDPPTPTDWGQLADTIIACKKAQD